MNRVFHDTLSNGFFTLFPPLIELAQLVLHVVVGEYHQRHQQHVVDAEPAPTQPSTWEGDRAGRAIPYPANSLADVVIRHVLVGLVDAQAELCPLD